MLPNGSKCRPIVFRTKPFKGELPNSRINNKTSIIIISLFQYQDPSAFNLSYVWFPFYQFQHIFFLGGPQWEWSFVTFFIFLAVVLLFFICIVAITCIVDWQLLNEPTCLSLIVDANDAMKSSWNYLKFNKSVVLLILPIGDTVKFFKIGHRV